MASHLEDALNEFPDLSVVRTVPSYPEPEELELILKTYGPDVLFVSFEDSPKALELVRWLNQEAGGVRVIGIHLRLDSRLLREGMRVGVREFLVEPFDRGAVAEACGNIRALLEEKPATYTVTEHVYAFLPSKAGAGVSTIAVNVMYQMAELLCGGKDEEPRRDRRRTIFVDLDMNSGIQRFLLGLEHHHTVAEAVTNLDQMDERSWPSQVSHVDALDVLHAGPVNPNIRIQPEQLVRLSEFLERNYAAVGFDLSGNMERFSLAVMERARKILLVSTPEIPSLYLAKGKLEFLKSVGMERNVGLVLNRLPKNPTVSVAQVEEIVGLPVLHTIPNNYYEVSQAVEEGRLLDPGSRVGGACLQLAGRLLNSEAPSQEEKSRFLQFISVGSEEKEPGLWRG